MLVLGKHCPYLSLPHEGAMMPDTLQNISVVMATYNGASFVYSQLQSIQNQTYLPAEIVVVDDKSTDDTLAEIARFQAESGLNIRVFVNSHNQGYTSTFARGLQLAEGEIVFLADQDDIWFPNKIEVMVSRLRQDDTLLMLIADVELADTDCTPIGRTKLQQMRSAGVADVKFVMGCASAVRSELLRLCVPFPNGCLGHDNYLALVARCFNGFDLMEQPLQLYRRHGSNTSQQIYNLPRTFNFLELFLWRVKKAFRVSLDLHARTFALRNEIDRLYEIQKNATPHADNSSFRVAIQKKYSLLKRLEQRLAYRKSSPIASNYLRLVSVFKGGVYSSCRNYPLLLIDLIADWVDKSEVPG